MTPYLLIFAMALGLILGFFAFWFFNRNQITRIEKAGEQQRQESATELAQLKSENEQLGKSLREQEINNARLAQELKGLSEIGQQMKGLQVELADLSEKNTAFQRQLAETTEQARSRGEQLADRQAVYQQNALLQAELAEKVTLLQQHKERSEEQLALLKEAREQLTHQMKIVSNEILEEKSQKFTETNRANMDAILGPLREQLTGFRKKVEDVYDKESRDRVALMNEIGNLKNLNNQISEDALNLTRALKGQAKTQGTWGELILGRVLEMSGLVAGREYETEVHHKIGDGRSQRPDVIVHLPDNKDVIIDSKVSLVGYEKYCSRDDPQEREIALAEHLRSIRNHVNQLSERKYEQIEGIESLDYVLMFVPIEPALLTALEKDPALFDQALKKNVMLVSPSTLLGTLRIIENIWRYEHQSQNAQEIASKAGDLYDKFVGFVEEFEKVGSRLQQARASYETAHNRLSSGTGNLVKRSEDLKKLGVKSTKDLPEKLTSLAEADVISLPDPGD